MDCWSWVGVGLSQKKLKESWKSQHYIRLYYQNIDLQAYHLGWLELLWVLNFYFNLSFCYQWDYYALFSSLFVILCTMCWGHLVSLIRVGCSLFCYKMFVSHWCICLRCLLCDHNKNHYLLILSCCMFCLSLMILLCFNKFWLCIMLVSSFNYSAFGFD